MTCRWSSTDPLASRIRRCSTSGAQRPPARPSAMSAAPCAPCLAATANPASGRTVATPVSCNSAVELSGLFDVVRRTRIGSPFVIEAMNALSAEGQATVCGYEANGGFLLGSAVDVGKARLHALPTRDAVLPIIATLVDARQQGLSLSALQAQLPARHTFSERLQNYPTAQSQALIAHLLEGDRSAILARLTRMFGDIAGTANTIDTTDGLRIHFDGGDIIHLRPSGNAPELRCYTESATPERGAWLNASVLGIL